LLDQGPGRTQGGVSGGLDRVFRAPFQHLVNQAVLAGGLGALEVVALGVARDRLEGLAGVLGEDLVEALAQVRISRGMDVDVRAWPWKPPSGWWIITREFGSA
jgi:hypothetical protein